MNFTDETLRLILITVGILVPAVALSARFAIKMLLKPVVEAITQLREVVDGKDGSTAIVLANQLRELQHENANLREEVARLSAVEDFNKQLQNPETKSSLPGNRGNVDSAAG